MKKPVPHIDERVLVDIGVPYSVRPAIVIEGVVVHVTLIF